MATKSLADKLGSGSIYNIVGNAVAGIVDVIVTVPLIVNTHNFTPDQVTQLLTQAIVLHGSVQTLTALALVVINNRFKLF